MKTQKFNRTLKFEELSEIVIDNQMAPLLIGTSDSDEISISIELNVRDLDEEINLDDFVKTDFATGKLSIELSEIDELEDRSNVSIKASILLPQAQNLTVETDNFPLAVSGLNAALTLHNENGPIAITDCEGRFTIENENGPIAINNCHGVQKITNENGPIRIHNTTGDFILSMENGPLSAEAISGDNIKIESENGPIKIRSACFTNVTVNNENGTLYYETLPVENGHFVFENENAHIHLVLPINFDYTLVANTEFGAIKSKLSAEVVKDGDTYRIVNGEGGTQIEITTENGMIKLSSDGHMNLDFIRLKMEQLKESIKNSKTFEDKEKVQNLMESISGYINKGLDSINEDKIKTAINDALTNMKATVESFDVSETKDKVLSSLDTIHKDLFDGFKEFVHNFKDKFETEFKSEDKHKGFHGNFANFIDKDQLKKMLEPLKKMKHFSFDLDEKEKDAVSERSRMKILEMLESGKITAEEAERLLKAINKE
ncbi:MAG: hypothetical protein CVU48_04015 [Candidatus Cloacimonetes bacterium HGW-Cloacimonetes-1]|jgi:hypothetical protein|nr:MAG: hypothetical protein CVU48_04015 [Candidatus Cloacimonetes bacterium HGW-Cloacimonetes-1]